MDGLRFGDLEVTRERVLPRLGAERREDPRYRLPLGDGEPAFGKARDAADDNRGDRRDHARLQPTQNCCVVFS
jgi:hypothetical protein